MSTPPHVAQLHNVKPREVVGGRTGALFEYQYFQAADAALSLLEAGDLACVYCEWHDDYVVECARGTYRFYQVKTRKRNQERWSMLDVFGAKKPRGRSKDVPAANASSIFSRMLEHDGAFGDRCARFALVSNHGVEPEIERILEAVRAVPTCDDLTGDARADFERLQEGLAKTFSRVTREFLLSFLRRFEVHVAYGDPDRREDTEDILAGRILRAADVELQQREAQKIGSDLVAAVRVRSQHPIGGDLPKDVDDLRARKGVQVPDVLRVLGLSVEGYKELRVVGRPAVLALSRLQRLCHRSEVPAEMIPDLCRAKALWHAWWLANRGLVEPEDAMGLKARCAKALRGAPGSPVTFEHLLEEAETIAKQFSSLPVPDQLTGELILGRMMTLWVESES